MIVDGSYTAWVRPTRRVHFALSLGMTLTGAILIAAGAAGGSGAARPAPLIGRTADSFVSGDNGASGSQVPAAPLLPVAPPQVKTPPHPVAKPHPKSRPHPHHTMSTPTRPAELLRPAAPPVRSVPSSAEPRPHRLNH
ncbi:hypothetical protein Caci_5638 [Catenulispora acidiphila DSM 44928]|uniref:Uncharacterized protein n=1 Tax=Catenulispora acidiphila (strain DSM 44928 / JCM 14897 / NBRC 102108 / NRRL B-24433 / ID139908) TaxID=479433 RepID=C7QC49_CATAD|nr:hypothetical protein [Catenulispora acidiphila]ACU74497.1 hypothetical protein Caci_5638 [Catenulispora acidiphila DSM 44928]